MYLEFSRLFTVFGSFAITFGLYAQAIKIYRTKSARDFTWVMLIALFVSELAWLNYGICLKEWPIVLTSLADVPATILAFRGFLLYKNSGR